MAAEAEEVPLFGLHHLKFVELKDFPEDTPDFSDVLGAHASNRCKARACRRDGTLNRVPLCAEDVIATGMEELFDEDGYGIWLCPKHAELVLGRAVEGRACTCTICSGHASGKARTRTSQTCLSLSVVVFRLGRGSTVRHAIWFAWILARLR